MKQAISVLIIVGALVVQCSSQTISRGQTIVAAEYFTGTDPGTGNGTSISATYGSATANVSFSAQVPQGSVLYFRFKSSDGVWSAPYSVTGSSSSSGAALAGGEYFVNIDPGVGKGISFSVGSKGQTAIPSPALSRGDTLYLRVRDSFGRWSPARALNYNFKNMVDAQYYVKYSNGTITPATEMSLTDSLPNYPIFLATSADIPALTSSDTVYVRVQSDDSFWSEWTASPGVVTAVEGKNDLIPKAFKLYQAYPNPFNPSTTIMYDLPKMSRVVIAIYDVLGRNVRTLVNEIKRGGGYRVIFDASNLPSGVYFYRIIADGFAKTEKAMLVR